MANGAMVTSMITTTEVTYRILDKSEHERVAPVFTAHGWLMPPAETSMIAVAEQGNEIVGFFVFQVAGHMEPLYIVPEMRGKVNTLRLAHLLESQLPSGMPYFLFCNEQAAKIAEAGGAQLLPYKVMMKVVD